MPAADGMTLDARVGALTFPAEITRQMTLDPRGPEERFDFVFASYSPRSSLSRSASCSRFAISALNSCSISGRSGSS